ncbi:response regulator [Flammeovirga pectinis]|uniref:histidine kinase n=2 Tax=Flammeovirga pectinis TaxID=2494373 RepID=A0A3S9P2F2_9BACT|nr:response regulator [Flammeovirga pectinis]
MLIVVVCIQFIRLKNQAQKTYVKSVRNFKMLSLLMENSHDVIFSVDTNFNYLAFNNAHVDTMKSVYGCQIELGKNILKYMKVNNDEDIAKEDITRAINGEVYSIIRSYGNEEKHQRAHFEATYTPIKSENNIITGVSVVVRDVTDQYNSQENLKRSERKYKMLFHYNYLGALIILNGRIVDSNDTAVSLLGLELHELLGMSLDEVFINLTDNPLKEKRIVHYHNKGKKIFILREEVIGDDKDPQNILFIEDVTQKNKAEKELIRVNNQAKVLLESAKSYIFSVDVNYGIVFFNTRFSSLMESEYGISVKVGDKINGPKYHDFFYKFRENFERAFTNRKMFELEFKLNQEIYLQSVFSPLLNEKNEIYGLAIYNIDITRNKKHETQIYQLNSSLEQKVQIRTQELQQQRVKLDLALNAADVGTWSYLLDDKFLCDSRFLEIFGLDSITYTIHDFLKFVDASDIKKVNAVVKNISDGKVTDIDLSFKINHPSKNVQYLQIFGRSRLNSGVYEMNGVCWNLTSQKNIEQELESAKNEAVKSSAAKSLFLANISHEIRSPLNAIIGLSNILYKKFEDTNQSAEFIEQLKYIYFNGEYLSELINNILDFSRIDAGKMSISMEKVEIINLIRMIVKVHEFSSVERGIYINLEIDKSVPEVFLTDKTKFRQILTNLLTNAIKFTKDKTDILVKVKSVGTNFIFSVEDHGIGIPKDKLKVIFDSFEQADKSVTRKFGGTGLGLAISKRMTEMLNGTISVESKEGEGTLFTIVLPVKKSKIKSIDKEHTLNLNLKFQREDIVLVVEDNKMNQFMMKALFKQLELSIEIAENGEDAIQKIKSKKYNLILMDIHMPIMGGISAAKIIRQELKETQVPIVALTADAYWDKRFKAFAVGMNDYLTKPINRTELLNILSKYLIKDKDLPKNYLDPNVHSDLIDEIRKVTVDQTMTAEAKLKRLNNISNLLQDYDTGFVKYIDHLSEAIASEKKVDLF